jgi:hypothetical protein
MPLQFGISSRNLSPSIGEKAPKRYVVLNIWWNGQIGLMPLAVSALPFLVNRPNLLSSWKYRFTVVYPRSDFRMMS